ncbi:MAG TPA: DUF5317 family protein [Candidatus Limnocylindrales bacterium]|nr:DUF5317 family protein [Candidatus Limnocylindrales bacterium]
MFILYAIPIGLALGWLAGGRVAALADLRLRWLPLAFGGLLVQVVLFSGPAVELVGAAGPPLYLASTLAVLAAVVRNVRVPGLALVALGAAANLAAILANGGYMPADPAALASLGATIGEGYSNSVVRPDPALAPLIDRFATPPWLPFGNVFSVGDVAIGTGIVIAIASGMRRRSGPTA